MTNTKRRQKTITYKGTKYVGIMRAGKINVYTERTAHGQHLIAGVFNVFKRSWEHESKNTPLPAEVKNIFEEAFI